MEAIVLAGGLGTRLKAVVPDLPKPMAPIRGRPFLAYVLDCLAKNGVRRVVLSTGYRAEAVQAHFGQRYGGVDLAYSIEAHPLGTGGATRRALAQTAGEDVFVVNGDTLMPLDYAAMRDAHRAGGGAITVAVREVADTGRFGRVTLSAGGEIEAFAEKAGGGPGLINAGVYLLQRALFDGHALPEAFSLETDFLGPRVRELRAAAFLARGWFVDIGIPEEYARAQTMDLTC